MTGRLVMPRIKVAEKALAHLSRGLYRSPASALRELVSNAWDANATIVRIDTNYPNFFQISVEDNGDGFTRDEFERLMEGGIGNSMKRPIENPLINDRPIIGRLGIGMLGIAQICGAFTISARTHDDTGFRAHIRLYDLLKEKIDKEDETIVKTDEIDIGDYDFDNEFDPKSIRYGTTIITDEVHPTFVNAFQKSLKYENFKEPPLHWSKALGFLSRVRSLQELGDYWRLLWELSAACPIPYLNENALPDQLVVEDQKKLQSFDFKVIVDNIELYKPIYLEGNPGGYTTLNLGLRKQNVYGKELDFHGYIAVQEGTQIKPDELRGIMMRIKNVGIGYYDPSMLDYRINEGPRSRWLTGEIFVDKGLEDALNIDRDSFNRFHPEFRVIQEYIHNVLQSDIFPRVYKQIDVRSTTRAKAKEQARFEHLKTVVSQLVETPVVIRQESSFDNITSDVISKNVTQESPKDINHKPTPQVTISERENEVQIGLPSSKTLKTKKVNQQLATAILTIFEIAMQKDTPQEQRETFTELLLDLLAKW